MKPAFLLTAPNAIAPARATERSSGWDLYSPDAVRVSYGSVTLIPLGVRLVLPEGFEGQIRSRSGLSSRGIVVANSPGTIDSDYEGELIVLLTRLAPGETLLDVGTRVAQLIIAPVYTGEADGEAITLNPYRGSMGIGSTGV